ncbi:GNAT family N-acetyltransferase [Actinoplanes sp. NPDC049596]|uniref:GNAT family N-acetyltransferase n=1 Tax=unclassified Actinoplanes TaxID=2626549 RepID=UPI0034248238
MVLRGVSVRPATAGDAERLAEIVLEATEHQGRLPAMTERERAEWRDGFAEWSRRTVEEASPGNVLSVVLLGGEIVGRLRAVREERGVRLAGIQLVPAVQGRGIGTSIILGLRRDHRPLFINVDKDNDGARRLYERLRFTLCGETADEYLYSWGELGG